tara:strand:+ start:820 stop:1413 length:594 start_codon:yes stop_codon:yes gene_type:complete
MKVFILSVILILNIKSFAKADNIRDFEIEGMSIGDSLYNHFSIEKTTSSKVDWYDDLEKNKFNSYAFSSDKFQTYDFVDLWVRYYDKDLKIDSMAGVLYFGVNKAVKDINDCYEAQKNIADELLIIFKNAKKFGPTKEIFYEADPSGKTSYTDIYLDINTEYEVAIGCYDWSDEFLGFKEDHLGISLRSKELSNWLN